MNHDSSKGHGVREFLRKAADDLHRQMNCSSKISGDFQRQLLIENNKLMFLEYQLPFCGKIQHSVTTQTAL